MGLLLALALVARVLNRPEPVAITAAQVDLSAFRAANQALAQAPRKGGSRRQKPVVAPGSAATTPAPRAASNFVGTPLTVDLNRATAEELDKLPGIGPAVAARIVARRDSVRRFQKIEDLDPIRGIGPALIEKLRPMVTVR